MGKNFLTLVLAMIFCVWKIKQQKAKMNKWDYISKRNGEQNEQATYEMGKKCANHLPDKELISKTQSPAEVTSAWVWLVG